MAAKNIIKKNRFIDRQNRLAPFSRLGCKIMEARVRIYSRWQRSKRELVQGAVDAALLGTEATLMGLDSVATTAADALVKAPEIGEIFAMGEVGEYAEAVHTVRMVIKASVIFGIVFGTGVGMYELFFHNGGS